MSGDEKSSQLVYASSKLKNKKHTVEIKTLDNKGVEINYMSINYGASMLNAANIYKEKALGIALAIFCVLFVLSMVFVVLYFTLPKFREFLNKLFRLERQTSPETLAKKAKKKEERKANREAKKEENQKQKAESKGNSNTAVKNISQKSPNVKTAPQSKKPSTTSSKVETKKTVQTSAKTTSKPLVIKPVVSKSKQTKKK